MRSYKVHAHVPTHLGTAPEQFINGSFSFGQFDAAKKYCKENLLGYDAIQGGQDFCNGLRRFQAVNNDLGYGADIWVQTL